MKMLLTPVALCFLVCGLFGGDVRGQMELFPPINSVSHQDPVRLLGLNWTNCDNSQNIVRLKSLSVVPDPLILGGKVTISGAIDVSQDVGVASQIISADLELKMKVGDEYRDICPLIGTKLCHLVDLCLYMEVLSKNCPKIVEAQGNNCTCPIKQRLYEVKELSMILPTVPAEISGEFEVTIRIKDQSKELMCVDLKFCITKCN